jgi:tRNA nucleotidyltransferase/poly(A) polymerase
MNLRPHTPGYVQWVAKTLEDKGFETWAVGGAVRNSLLGLPPGDWDMATRAHPGQIRRIFRRTVPIGIEHGTVGVLTRDGTLVEVTTFRRDVETSGRHAVVEFADTLEEDLARRDFTINAVAWHPIREVFQDPFGGQKDLADGLLRTVGDPNERFSEDFLRVLRALRFSGRFRLRIHPDTWVALCGSTHRLSVLSPERIREELSKVLSEDRRPSGALALYSASGVLEALYPELAHLEECQRPEFQEDLWTHSLLLVDRLPDHRPRLRLAALLHGVGVPGPTESEASDPRIRGRDRTVAIMVRFRFSNAETAEVSGLVALGLEAPVNLESRADLRRWLHEAGPDRLHDFGRLWAAKARLDHRRWGVDGREVARVIRRLRNERRRRPPLRLEDLAVNGRDLIHLGLKPGPLFGEILETLMDRVLEDPTLNHADRLKAMVEEEWAGGGGST